MLKTAIKLQQSCLGLYMQFEREEKAGRLHVHCTRVHSSPHTGPLSHGSCSSQLAGSLASHLLLIYSLSSTGSTSPGLCYHHSSNRLTKVPITTFNPGISEIEQCFMHATAAQTYFPSSLMPRYNDRMCKCIVKICIPQFPCARREVVACPQPINETYDSTLYILTAKQT